MTDKEMLAMCADAMGWKESYWSAQDPERPFHALMQGNGKDHTLYDPLHDDAQAMALVKKLDLAIDTMAERTLGWCVWHADDYGDGDVMEPSPTRVINTDLNRAIVECVANMRSRSTRTTKDK